MSNLMNNPGDEGSNEAERQWWCAEFEFNTQEPDGKMVWVSVHSSRNCPDCRRIVQSWHSAQPQQHQPKQKHQSKDAADENV